MRHIIALLLLSISAQATTENFYGTGLRYVSAYTGTTSVPSGTIFGQVGNINDKGTTSSSVTVCTSGVTTPGVQNSCVYQVVLCADDATINCASGNYVTVTANSYSNADTVAQGAPTLGALSTTSPCPLVGTFSTRCSGIMYVPSSSTLWGTINVKDGSRHQIYGIVISTVPASPGLANTANNAVMDFGPLPFTWNAACNSGAGCVDNRYPASAVPLPSTTTTSSTLAVLVNTNDPCSIGIASSTNPTNPCLSSATGTVLCACPTTGQCGSGSTNLYSNGFAGVYLAGHSMACGNFFIVNLSLSASNPQTTTQANVASLLTLRNSFPASFPSFKAIGLAWAMPAAAQTTVNSVTYAIAYSVALGIVPAEIQQTNYNCTAVGGTANGLAVPTANPYFNNSADPTTLGYYPTMHIAATLPHGGFTTSILPPYSPITGTSDQWTMTVDGGSPQTATLTTSTCSGGTSCTAQEIASQLMSGITGITAYPDERGYIRVFSSSTGVAGTSSVLLSTPASHSSYALFFTSPGSTPVGSVQSCASLQPNETGNSRFGCLQIPSATTLNTIVTAAVANAASSPTGGQYYTQINTQGTSYLFLPWTISSLTSWSSVGFNFDGTNAAPITSPTLNKTNLVAYTMVAGVDTVNSAASFLSGVGFYYVNSSSPAVLIQDFGANQANAGAAFGLTNPPVAVGGHSIEPCDLLGPKSVQPEIFLQRYTNGDVMINAISASNQYPAQDNWFGDPLAQFAPLGTGSTSGSMTGSQSFSGGAVIHLPSRR